MPNLSLESAEAFYISLNARANLITLHGDKVTDYPAFLNELQMGVSLFNIEFIQREASDSKKDTRQKISEFSDLLSEVENKARELSFTNTGLLIQRSSSEKFEIESLENFADDALKLRLACDSIQIEPKRGQKSWDTDIAYFTFKALKTFRDNHIAMSDSPSSVLVKTIQILLNDIAAFSELGKHGYAGDMVVSDTSAIGMVRKLIKALKHTK